MVEHPLSGGDRARGHESGSVKRKKAQTPSLDSSYDAESSGGDDYSSSSISSARERRIGNSFRAPNFARDHDRDSDRTTARRDTPSTPAESCGLAASTDVVRLRVRSKLQSRVRGVEQPIRAPSGARGRDRDSAPLRRRRRPPAIPMSSCARQLLERVLK